MSANNNNPTDTFQWDTVFALKIDEVNDAIESNDSTPKTMTHDIDGGAQLTASFDHWKIASTGDGSLVHFDIPIKNCTLSFNGKSKSFQGIDATAELQLHFYNAEINENDDPNKIKKHLKVKSHQEEDEEIVKAVFMNTEGHNMSAIFKGMIAGGFKQWLNENLSIFDHIFATVNLNKKAASGAFSWLQPTTTSYAFISNTDPKESMLGVMCMTEERTNDNLIDEIANNVIPKGSSAGFLISQSRFIEKMVKPSLSKAFKGLSASDFKTVNQGKAIELISLDKSFTVTHDGKTYEANLEKMRISLENKRLTMHTETKTEITSGIYSLCTSDHTYEIKLYNKSDGTQSLKYEEVGEPIVTHHTKQDVGVTIGEIIAGIIAGIILAILVVLTDGLILIAVIIIGGILTGLISSISTIIQAIGTDDAPDISMMLLNCVAPIQWTDKKDFTLNQAALCGPLQLGGTFNS